MKVVHYIIKIKAMRFAFTTLRMPIKKFEIFFLKRKRKDSILFLIKKIIVFHKILTK